MTNPMISMQVVALGALTLTAGHAVQPASTATASDATTPIEAAGVGAEQVAVVELRADSKHSVPQDIDLALCLDTSGSMEGLIDSARQRLWALVNELALAEPTPRLRVALLTYGSPTYGPETGFVRTLVPLTDDLDLVSLRLFELTTNGGDEYVARVTQRAAQELEWSPQAGSLKMIVVAGNESAEQDPELTLELACGLAIERGIVVNSLYCAQTGGGVQTGARVQQLTGNAAQSGVQGQQVVGNTLSSTLPPVAPAPPALQPLDAIALGWKRVATLADGAFAMIDKDAGVILIETPFDDLLAQLSGQLNETYIPYGSGAGWNVSNQAAQDSNARGLNTEAAASRALTKAGKLYVCGWDLLDSLGAEQLAFEDIDREQLPEDLRSLSDEELRTLIEEKRAARTRIQAEIVRVGGERETWLAAKRAELGTDESMAFDTPLRQAFRELAEARGFRFAESEAAPEPSVEVLAEVAERPDGC